MSEKTVTISEEEYKQLKKDSLFLECLQGVGVDNWEGWDDSMELFREAMKGEKE
jgi:hypothetical protein